MTTTTTNDTPDVILPELEVSDLVDKIPIELLDDSLLIDVDDLMNHQQQPQQQQPLISGRPPFRTDSFNKGTSNSLVLGTPFSILSSPGKQQQQQQQQFNINTSAQPFIPTIIPDVNAAVAAVAAVAAAQLGGIESSIPLQGPSGPRKPGQGVEDQEQLVVSTETDEKNGGVRIRVTLLAAGFVIGNAGASVREISAQTGALIRSWTQPAEFFFGGFARPTRVFCLESTDPAAIAEATEIIYAAVDRYRALCEMKKRGEFVQKAQKIKNVEFSFQPPPRQIMQRQRHAINNNNLVLIQQQQQFPFQQAALAQQQLLMQQQIIQQHMNYQHQTGGIYQQQQQQFHQHQLQHQQFYHNGMNHQQYYQG